MRSPFFVRTGSPAIFLAAVASFTFGVSHARAAEADAFAISQNIQALHVPNGTLLDPVLADAGSESITGYTRCGDSATWTGHYLAAEAFRYAVTNSADALANARRAVDGIKSLVDITGNNVLARCRMPENSPYANGIASEEASNGIYHDGAGNFWVGNTSRDQYSGVLFGLGVAYEYIKDPVLNAEVADLVTRLVQFLQDHGWTIVLPNGQVSSTFLVRPDERLAFLQLARYVNSGHFSSAYQIDSASLASSVYLPVAFDALSDSSYFKFNLDAINLYTLMHHESGSLATTWANTYSIFRNHTALHGNAFFNMIDFAVNGPDAGRDAETRTLLDDWLKRSRRDIYVDNSAKYPACGDGGASCAPIAVPDRVSTDFLWQRSPFQITGGGSGLIESAGIDYLLPYWMARYFGVVAKDSLSINSGASGAPVLASESIGSLFGSGLATVTQIANAQPLPQSLGNLTLTVIDALGVSRAANLYFVSPAQINFVVPKGTAPGISSATVEGHGMNPVTLSFRTRAVAPALFTADATGKGVAAGTALRVNGGQSISSDMFACTGSGCTAVPIDVSAGAVYLILYGTGIRNVSSLANVSCRIGGMNVPVLYAGSQPSYAGLDQVNVSLPPSLHGLGETDLALSVNGQSTNTVRVAIR